MAFCVQCGEATAQLIPDGDQRLREVCTVCTHIHYKNPHVICGALVYSGDKVLLCRRAIEPAYGLWTLPAGFMELGETMEEGAMRETREEAEAELVNPSLYCIYNIPQIGQIYSLFIGELLNGKFGAGEESLECTLFSEADVPWDKLAFPSVANTLRHYFTDRLTQHFPIHHETIEKNRKK